MLQIRNSKRHLFNLADDPEEENNLAAECPEVVTSLHERFLAQRSKDVKHSG
ncbi:MAG TPA: hypothetical protein VIR77_00890 [Pontiella sp.]